MAKKLNSKPQIAYQQGRKDGYIAGGRESMEFAKHFAALAIYNISHLYTRSEKKSKELVKAFCEEQERIYRNEFWHNNDQVLLAVDGVKKIYKEVGFYPVASEYLERI